MKQILCSTGALMTKTAFEKIKVLKEAGEKLSCDGFELMVDSLWYDHLDELLTEVKAMNLNIPVVHCHKRIGEMLSGIKVTYENGSFREYRLSEKEDADRFEEALDKFQKNVLIASELGAEKMVIHLWNGTESDRNLSRNIERFSVLRQIAEQKKIELLAENVICNTYDPLSNLSELQKVYPDACFVYDTKMAEFHGQTMKLFEPEYVEMVKDGHVRHLHINDYDGGYMDWSNFKVLPIGKGHVDFDTFFENLSKYGYQGDFTVEATAIDATTGEIQYEMLNQCFEDLRKLINRYL